VADGAADAADIAAEVQALLPAGFPRVEHENIAVGGMTAATGVELVGIELRGRRPNVVTIAFGTNDCYPGARERDRIEDLPVEYELHVRTMAEIATGIGATVLIPTIPWARTPPVLEHGPLLNAILARIVDETGGVLPGPDLWSLVQAEPALLAADDLHFTPAGSAALRRAWAAVIADLA